MKHLWYTAALTGLLGLCGTALAQDTTDVEYQAQLPPVIDREVFFGDPEIAGAQISPDGRFITFRRPYNGVINIWVKGVDEPFDSARPITADTTRPVTGYFWTEDSRFVLYVQDKGGDENYHVYAVDPSVEADPETGVPPARDLTPYEGTRAFIYAVPEATPDKIIVGLNDRDASYHDAYRVDVNTGERELLYENNEQLAGWRTDLEGNLRLAIRTTPDGGTEVLRLDGQSLTVVYGCSNQESCGPYRFHKDGRRVYMVTNKGDDVDLARLILFDPATGEEEFVESDPESRVDFGGAAFSDVTDELVATFYVGDRVRIYPKTEQVAHDLEVLRENLPEGEISFGSSTEDENLHLVRVARDVDPGSTYLYNRETGEVEFVYRSRPDLPSEHLAPMQPIRYTARDGLEIPAYLTLPKGVEPVNLPVVIHPHGGPWARDTWGYDSYAQYLANRGYAVLQPNFRGSTGYGKAFWNAGDREWGTGAMQHDISDGVKHLIEQGIADPERIGIFGGSYGGYATLAGLAFTPELYAAGISYVGPSNLITLLESIPPYWAPIRSIFNVRLGDPEDPEDHERLLQQSPLFSAEQIRAPLLVIQGANDPRVKKAESEQIVVALRDLGRDVEYLLAEDEGHGFRGRENRLVIAAAIERFFAERLGGRYQEEMPEEIAATLEELTVDVSTVVLPQLAAAAAIADTAALPMGDGSMILPSTMRYKAKLQMMGQELDLDLTRNIEAAALEGRAVWRIIDSVDTPMGTSLDTFDLHIRTLMPVRRVAGGMGTMNLSYKEDAITGELGFGGQTMDVDMELAHPVLGDGAALELVIAGLPLMDDYETTLRIFDPLMQKVRPMLLTVEGTEVTECEAGMFEAYVVKLTPLDGDQGGKARLRVMQAAPHHVIRGEYRLPAMMGGGTMTTELASIGSTR